MSSELRVDKIIPVDGVPTSGGGGIVQTVFAENNTIQTFSFNSSSFSPQTVCSASITPKFNTSKILVSFNCHYDNNTANQRGYITIYRSIGGGTASDIVGSRGLVEVWNPDSRTQASCMDNI